VGVGVGVDVGAGPGPGGTGVGSGPGGAGVGVGAGGGAGDEVEPCVIERLCPAITNVTARTWLPPFGLTTIRTWASPLPDVGEIDAQLALLDAVHEQAAWVRTSTSASPPWLPRVEGTSPTENAHCAPCCDSATCRSATDTFAWRGTGSAFSATRKPTDPSPCPSAADVNEIQLTGLVARQAHSRATFTLSVPLPPAAPNAPGDGDTDASQRVDVGEVTFVEVVAELPHPAAASARDNSRGTREFTGETHAQDSPAQSCLIASRCDAWYHQTLQRNTY
jgi:hypothetical protein